MKEDDLVRKLRLSRILTLTERAKAQEELALQKHVIRKLDKIIYESEKDDAPISKFSRSPYRAKSDYAYLEGARRGLKKDPKTGFELTDEQLMETAHPETLHRIGEWNRAEQFREKREILEKDWKLRGMLGETGREFGEDIDPDHYLPDPYEFLYGEELNKDWKKGDSSDNVFKYYRRNPGLATKEYQDKLNEIWKNKFKQKLFWSGRNFVDDLANKRIHRLAKEKNISINNAAKMVQEEELNKVERNWLDDYNEKIWENRRLKQRRLKKEFLGEE